jgi:hypothetical protein
VLARLPLVARAQPVRLEEALPGTPLESVELVSSPDGTILRWRLGD